MDYPEQFKQATPAGAVSVGLAVVVVRADPAFHVPYEGADPAVRAQFGGGFFPSFGSGLAYKGSTEGGGLEFFCLTDRGPNGDGPAVPAPGGSGTSDSKIFPAPGFVPMIGVLKVDQSGAWIASVTPVQAAPGQNASGLPLPHGAAGSSDEVPLFDSLAFEPGGKAGFHPGGMDPEAIAYDRQRGKLWLADEYGPFLMMVDPASGLVERRYGPGSGLPPVLALRRANRGMEGMTLDPSSGRIHAFLQSPISDGHAYCAATGASEQVEHYARFVRWVEFDPESGATAAMYAYPLDPADFARQRTGHAKLGDLVALGQGKFIVIEQGEGAAGRMFNHLMLVELAQASCIAGCASDLEKSSMGGRPVGDADWSRVVPLKKTRLLDLNALGWVAEKAEGLALVDEYTVAISNDNDFGMQSRVYDAAGNERAGADVTQLHADATGRLTQGAAPGDAVRIARVDEQARPLTLWLLRFDRPLGEY